MNKDNRIDKIIIRGARVNNLKNINIDIPHNELVVITGLSGSGKSSLAFDTIYAEGQRRYVESLSSYARQFLEKMNKPDVDQIEGLAPAIAIDQKSVSRNPRSTVGTITEIYDYLRLLYAKIGEPYCPNCRTPLVKTTLKEIVTAVNRSFASEEIFIAAPIVVGKKGNHEHILEQVINSKYSGARIDGEVVNRENLRDFVLQKEEKHNIDILVNKINVKGTRDQYAAIEEVVKLALELGNGMISILNRETEINYSEFYKCHQCGFNIPDIQPNIFSFNSPQGACPECTGLGTKMEILPELVITNPRLTIAEGAIKPWVRIAGVSVGINKLLDEVARTSNFRLDIPFEKFTEKQKSILLYGTGKKEYLIDNRKMMFEGIIPILEKKYDDSEYMQSEVSSYMQEVVCSLCAGKRLKPESLAILINEMSIAGVTQLNLEDMKNFINHLDFKLESRNKKIATPIIAEIKRRLELLFEVGLNYLTLDRASHTLSGGELQRIRLATQIGSKLTGVIYILDEPSIGLHPRDTERLIEMLKKLRDLGNTVIVVEHDRAIMEAADRIVDIGPGAGEYGGEVIAEGTIEEIKSNQDSLTGRFLAGKAKIEIKEKYRGGSKKSITIIGASEFNLKNIDVKIPLAKFVCITGVSGSGKSTLMTEILSKALARKFYNAKAVPGKHKEIKGLENIDKVITIDQSPIGRTPRSNPATYTGVFTGIRDVFTEVMEAKIRGFDAGKFSFNVKGGRCEACGGDGMVRIEMKFLPDVYVDCEVCHGKRYNKEVLDVHYHGKNIADVLEMTVQEGKKFFRSIPSIYNKLAILEEVGLGYIKLGQSATTLSGGEAQRVKLATELSRRSTGKTLYILDEPTTGLHFEDIKKLLKVLNRLVDKKNTVLVIEHNMDVIKNSDWIIDLGPDGGDQGGYLVAEGTPAEVMKSKDSYTAKFLQ